MDPIALLFLLPLLLGRGSAKSSSKRFNLPRYAPGTPEQIELFQEAARHLGLPTSWAEAPSFHELLTKESGGWVGRPTYEYKSDRWGWEVFKSKNSGSWPALWAHLRAGGDPPKGRGATGMGQLILQSVDKHYPDGRAGIGDAWNEAVGMLSYLNARWKSPDRAIECYKENSCFSGVGIDGYPPKSWNGY